MCIRDRSLIVSLVLSLTLIPVLARYSILTNKNRESLSRHNPLAVFLERVIKMVYTNPLIGRTIGVLAIAVSIGFIVGAVFVGRELTFNIFPPAKDGNEIGVTASFPGEQPDFATSEQTAREIGDIVLNEIGDEVELVSYTRDFQSGASNAQLFIQLTPFQDRDPTSQDLIAQLRQTFDGFAGAAIEVRSFDAGPPTLSLPFRSQLFSEDAEAVLPLAEELAEGLRSAQLERSNGDPVEVTRVEVQRVQNIARTDGRRFIEIAAGFDGADTTTVVGVAQSY